MINKNVLLHFTIFIVGLGFFCCYLRFNEFKEDITVLEGYSKCVPHMNSNNRKSRTTGFTDVSLVDFFALTASDSQHTFNFSAVEKYHTAYLLKCHSKSRTLTKSAPDLPLCACLPTTLKGTIIDQTSASYKFSMATARNIISMPDVKPGGSWEPEMCHPRWRVAIIIPYRNRKMNLTRLLGHLHPLLQNQQLHYRIFVIEQRKPDFFNRASLLNIGFLEAMRTEHNFGCIFFHDVDVFIEDDRAMYTCEFAPLHLGGYRSKVGYRIPWKNFFGGITALTPEQIQETYGYSNRFFGWGSEDVEQTFRIKCLLPETIFYRYPQSVSRSFADNHGADEDNPHVNRLSGKRYYHESHYQSDGLTSVRYTIIARKNKALCTWIKVDLEKPESHAFCSKFGLDCWSVDSLKATNVDCCYEDRQAPRCCRKKPKKYQGTMLPPEFWVVGSQLKDTEKDKASEKHHLSCGTIVACSSNQEIGEIYS